MDSTDTDTDIDVVSAVPSAVSSVATGTRSGALTVGAGYHRAVQRANYRAPERQR